MEDLSTVPDIPITLVGAGAGTVVIQTKVSGDAQYRHNVKADGTLEWGSGSAAADVTLGRTSAGVLEQKSTGTAQAYYVYGVYTDAANYERLAIETVPGLRSTIFQQKAGSGAVCDFRFGVSGLANVTIVTNNSSRWDVNSSGHMMGATDNTYDIGGSGATRPRSIYWGTQALGVSGSAATPSIAGASFASTGLLWRAGPTLAISLSGTEEFAFVAGTASVLASTHYFGWSSTTSSTGSADVRLRRAGAGILSQSNTTNAQGFRVYNTTDSDTTPVNYERGVISWEGNVLVIGAQKGGAGATRFVNLQGGDGTAKLQFHTDGNIRHSAHFLGGTDNTYDIGATGATRPRDIFVGSRIYNGDGSSALPSYSFGAGTDLGFLRGSSTTVWFAGGGSARISFGTTSLRLVAAHSLSWSSDTNPDTAADTILTRDGAGIVALKNGANACRYRAYGNATIYTELRHDGTNGQLGSTSGRFQYYANGTNVYFLETTGHFLWNTDNSMDLGATGANRPRSVYVGTSISVGTSPSATGSIRVQYATAINSRNSVNSSDVSLIYAVTTNAVVDTIRIGEASAGVYATARSGGAAPTTSDLPAGCWTVWRDTGGATTKIYYNNAGAIIASAAFS